MRQQRLAVEIGGTFTDIILFESQNGRTVLRSLNVPSTPHRPELGVLDGIDRLDLD